MVECDNGEPSLRPEDPPEDIEAAESALRVATRELVQLAEHIALWKALGGDGALHDRLDNSYVGAAAFNVLLALRDAIVLGLARMFDDDGRGLNTLRALNAVADPDNAAWLLGRYEARFRTPLAVLLGDAGGSDAERADRTRMREEFDARDAAEDFQERRRSFLEAQRDFRRGEVRDALRRLKEMRRKEVAHTDMRPEWTTARPKAGDIDLVFDAVRELVLTANLLCTGDHCPELRDLALAGAMARCFTAVLRPESGDERRAAADAAAIHRPIALR